jgi:uncharacterized protein GlcG (DUF336 family)
LKVILKTAEQVKTKPARFQSALSMLQGEILLIPGGTPLIIDNVVVGGGAHVSIAAMPGAPDVKAGLAAWEKISPESALAATNAPYRPHP